MINSFQSLYTITSGLILQQLEQEVIASNIANANSSVDSDGYLMNSLEQVNVGSGAELTLSSDGSYYQVGTGPTVESVTSLRSSFLDSQIQQESTIVGYYEMLANSQGTGILNSIQNILSGSTTLNSALNTFASDWAALGANADPATDTLDRADVVQSGVAFAELANSQFNQLENLQTSNGQQINSTVAQINTLLQDLSAINRQLLNTPGSNQNTLLDARDYDLDKLSRLVNIQASYGASGTVSVYLSGSNVALVDAAGAAILQTNVTNVNYPNLVGITIQTPEGGTYQSDPDGTPTDDIASYITGGNLGGELQGQNAILGYMEQVDQIATSVINVTNNLEEAGYAADGATTNTPFFTGTGAASIGVNEAIINNNSLIGAAISPNSLTNGQVAQFLGNLPNLMADNFVESNDAVIPQGATIDPTQAISTQVVGADAGGQFMVNDTTITWTSIATPTDPASIDQLLSQINGVSNVYAVYNDTTNQFYMYSDNPIQITNISGNFTTWANIANVLTSSIQMNNYEAGLTPLIDSGPFGTNTDAWPMDSTIPYNYPPGLQAQQTLGPNSIAFKVVPSTNGVFTINGNTFVWNNGMSLNAVVNSLGSLINNPPATYTINGKTYPNPYPGWNGASDIAFSFNPGTQTVTLTSTQNGAISPQPIEISDISGNFTVFTGLNASNETLGGLTSGLTSQIASNVSAEQSLQSQAQNSLTQLNNAQANIAGVSTGNGQAGVSVDTLEEEATQSMIAYNAMLEVLQAIDDMYVDLVNVLGAAASAPTLTQQSSSAT